MTKFKGEAGVAPSPLQQGYLFCGGKKLLKRFGAKRQSNYDEIQGRGRSRAEPAATRLLTLWWQETAEAVWSEAT